MPDEWATYILDEEMKTCICKMCLAFSNEGKLGIAKEIKQVKEAGKPEEKANIVIWFENMEDRLEENKRTARIAERRAREYNEEMLFGNPLDNSSYFSRRRRRRRHGF